MHDAGAGSVADSISEMEWKETLDKAAGILLAAERFGEGWSAVSIKMTAWLG